MKKFFVTVLSLFSVSVWANSLNSIDSIQVLENQPSSGNTQVVVSTTKEIKFSYFGLSNPERLVLDIRDSTLNAKLPIVLNSNPHIKKIRLSNPAYENSYRLVFELTTKQEPIWDKRNNKLLITFKGQGVVNSASSSSAGKVVAQTNTSNVNQGQTASKVPSTTVQKLGKIVVAIDAGHGGQDPGSIGPAGNYEKHVNLAIAKKIAERLNRTSNIRAVLTRDKDAFLNLNARSNIARKNNAMLLLSIHADSYSTPEPRGGSVFVLSTRRANTEIARWVEKKEEQSQLLGGGGAVLAEQEDKNVSQTVLDLQFSYSQTEGNKLATHVLREMRKVTRLHSSKPIYASLAVLKSPDIPSILVETGFISNPQEEKLLINANHQNQLADSIAKAVQAYFRENPPEGMVMVNHSNNNYSNGDRIHTVKSGEVLSIIAQKYDMTTQEIMALNNISNPNSVRVGQKLRVAEPKPEVVNYTVKSGDYLGKIANQHGVSVSSIRQANNLTSDTVRVGQKLIILIPK